VLICQKGMFQKPGIQMYQWVIVSISIQIAGKLVLKIHANTVIYAISVRKVNTVRSNANLPFLKAQRAKPKIPLIMICE